MRHAGKIAALALGLAATGAVAQDSSADVDPAAYTGLWYEIARTPAPFEQQCAGGVTAQYERSGEDTVRVVNRCDLPDGTFNAVKGTAQVENENFSRLSVDFPQSPSEGVNYVIEATGPLEGGQYQWAVVRGPGEGYGWILSRTPELSDGARQAAEAAMEEAGLDPGRLQDTDQPPQHYDPQAM